MWTFSSGSIEPSRQLTESACRTGHVLSKVSSHCRSNPKNLKTTFSVSGANNDIAPSMTFPTTALLLCYRERARLPAVVLSSRKIGRLACSWPAQTIIVKSGFLRTESLSRTGQCWNVAKLIEAYQSSVAWYCKSRSTLQYARWFNYLLIYIVSCSKPTQKAPIETVVAIRFGLFEVLLDLVWVNHARE